MSPSNIGQYTCRAITIIPYGEAWRRFQSFMGDLYGHGQMRGPFDYGCLLTLSGRCEGYTSPGMFPLFIDYNFCIYLIFESRKLWNFEPGHSQKKFEGFWRLRRYRFFRVVWCQASELYQLWQAQYVFLLSIITIILIVWLSFFFLFSVPIYDASRKGFRFTWDDFGSPCLCTKDLVESLTCWLIPLFRFFLPCPPTPRGYQVHLRLQQAAPLLTMFCL